MVGEVGDDHLIARVPKIPGVRLTPPTSSFIDLVASEGFGLSFRVDDFSRRLPQRPW